MTVDDSHPCPSQVAERSESQNYHSHNYLRTSRPIPRKMPANSHAMYLRQEIHCEVIRRLHQSFKGPERRDPSNIPCSEHNDRARGEVLEGKGFVGGDGQVLPGGRDNMHRHLATGKWS